MKIYQLTLLIEILLYQAQTLSSMTVFIESTLLSLIILFRSRNI